MATYIRLTDYKSSDEKEQEFFNPENRYESKQTDFYKVPSSPIAYWISDRTKYIFENNKKLDEIAQPRAGMQTGDNNKFLRLWSEVYFEKIGLNYSNRKNAKESKLKWFPYNKGGEFQKWYGNQDYVVNWEKDGIELYNFQPKSVLRNSNYYFKQAITWSFIGSSTLAVRFAPQGFLFDVGGSSTFPKEDQILYIIAFLTSKVTFSLLKIIAPTVNFQVGDLKALPIIFPLNKKTRIDIEKLSQECINITKEDWNTNETSWDFTKNELIKYNCDGKIETAYSNYCNYWKEQHHTLHQNEEELNRLFIDIYELQDELTPEVELKDITILKNETKIIDGVLVFQADEIIKQFISYGVGVMFGRYSLDSDGLLIANRGQEVPSSKTFEIDDDNVIPVLEDDYFKDDISSRFTQFVKATFGEENLSENLNFIEKSLGTSIRKYFVKGFYEDHIKRYKKRPIYWMISSPKKGFMTLIYMHRYTSDIFATIQNDYLREYIEKLENNIDNLQRIADDESNSNIDRTKATKEITKSNKILDEIIQFDRNSLTRFAQDGIEIDLDDGVKVNYCKFKDVLYPISGLCK